MIRPLYSFYFYVFNPIGEIQVDHFRKTGLLCPYITGNMSAVLSMDDRDSIWPHVVAFGDIFHPLVLVVRLGEIKETTDKHRLSIGNTCTTLKCQRN